MCRLAGAVAITDALARPVEACFDPILELGDVVPSVAFSRPVTGHLGGALEPGVAPTLADLRWVTAGSHRGVFPTVTSSTDAEGCRCIRVVDDESLPGGR